MIDFIAISSGVFVGYITAFGVLYIISTIVSNIKSKKRTEELKALINSLDNGSDDPFMAPKKPPTKCH